MAAISQMTFSNAFRELKDSICHSNFMETCSQVSNWQYISIGSGNGLAPNRRQAIIWTDVGLSYWRVYASPGLNEYIQSISFKAVYILMRYTLWLTHWGRENRPPFQRRPFQMNFIERKWLDFAWDFTDVCS